MLGKKSEAGEGKRHPDPVKEELVTCNSPTSLALITENILTNTLSGKREKPPLTRVIYKKGGTLLLSG